MKTGLVLIGLIVAVTAVDDEASKYFLPGNVIPTYYEVNLLTKIEQFEDNNENSFVFDGQVLITLSAVEDNVTSIALNSDDTITIHSASLTSKDETPISLGTGNYDRETTILVFELEQTLPKNKAYNLTIAYSGRNQNNGNGFYRTTYGTSSLKRWVLSTQFESVAARTAFPCFDEPKYKAIWVISVSLDEGLYKSGYNVLSNGAQQLVSTNNGIVTILFLPTPLPVSSYLIAIIVSDYKSTPPAFFNSSYPDPSVGDIKEFRTWGRSIYIDDGLGVTTQTAGAALLQLYTKNYNIGYGYDKMDQVAVSHFGGGMENWGLVVYGEDVLDESENGKEWVLTLTAHELGHQWFGDLVTFHWWSDIWLNEGFATYTEYFGADEVRVPGLNNEEWKLPSRFVTRCVQYSLGWDYDDRSHALTSEVYKPSDIESSFDSVAYEKGGTILRMWRNILGNDAFQKALHNYILANKESVSTPELLLSSLDTVVGESASDFEGQLPSQIFRTWHLAQGYPVVTANKSPDDPATYVLTQEKFVLNNPSSAGTVWTIPISYSTSEEDNFNDTSAALWLRAEAESANINLPGPVEWIVVNNQEGGYYRVNYDQENWDALFRILNNSETFEQIHEINRMQIADDSAYLAQSMYKDYLSYDRYLNITTYLKHEKEYHVWMSAVNNLKYLNNMLQGNRTVYPLFKQYLTSLMLPQYQRLTLHEKPNDTYLDKKLRSLIVNWVCKMDHLNCVSATQSLLHKSLVLKLKINSGARRAAYCTGARLGNRNIWNLLWKKYLISKNTMEKADLLYGLGCTTDPDIVEELLQKTIEETSEIPNETLPDILLSLQEGNVNNARIVFKFIKNNSGKIAKKLQGKNPLGKVLEKVAQSLSTQDDLRESWQLLDSMKSSKQRQLQTASISAKKALSIIDSNKAWIKKKRDSVYLWLKANY